MYILLHVKFQQELSESNRAHWLAQEKALTWLYQVCIIYDQSVNTSMQIMVSLIECATGSLKRTSAGCTTGCSMEWEVLKKTSTEVLREI